MPIDGHRFETEGASLFWDARVAGDFACHGARLSNPGGLALAAAGIEIGVETNGTLIAPPGLDWICVSPKSTAPLAQTSGDELKLVFPQTAASPQQFEGLAFSHFFLQPMDGPDAAAALEAAIAYCLLHPQWRLSLQTHKLTGLP